MIDPERPVRPAFDRAREKTAFLESRLTETQREAYDRFLKDQEREKEEQKRKAERAKAAYDAAKEKAPRLVRNYDPPVRIRDPHLRRLAVIARSEHQKLTTLERSQAEDRVRKLETLDRQRDKQEKVRQAAPQVTRRRAGPEFTRAAEKQPQAQGQSRESALSRAFEKARAQDEARQHSQARSRTHQRGRNRD